MIWGCLQAHLVFLAVSIPAWIENVSTQLGVSELWASESHSQSSHQFGHDSWLCICQENFPEEI